jgi:hypothetical protein
VVIQGQDFLLLTRVASRCDWLRGEGIAGSRLPSPAPDDFPRFARFFACDAAIDDNRRRERTRQHSTAVKATLGVKGRGS